MIDKTELNAKIRETADLFLSDIKQMEERELQENLRYFADKAKEIAEGILEQYVFSVYNQYTEGEFAISNVEKLSRFCNLYTGYQQQMLDWIAAHKLEVKEEIFEMPHRPLESASNRSMSPKVVVGVGTIVAVGLFVFSNIWIALVAEILTLALARIQTKRISYQQEQKQMELDHYALILDNKREQLVSGMIEELDKWLDMGIKASDDILESLNI